MNNQYKEMLKNITPKKQLDIIDVPGDFELNEVLNEGRETYIKDLEQELKQHKKVLKVLMKCIYYWDSKLYQIACNVKNKLK